MSYDNTAKLALIASRKAASQQAKGGTENVAAIIKWIPPGECADRNRIVFDDSGSMDSQIENAKQGVVEFLRNCIPNQTSVAVHWMNTTPAVELQSDLVKLGNDVLERKLSSGGTPFFNTCKIALEAKPQLTRLIAFTDGSPTDELHPEQSDEIRQRWDTRDRWIESADIIIKIAHAIGDQSLSGGYVSKTSGKHGPCIPIDTVFFGNADWAQREMKLLKYLSEQTGGYFLHFDPAKPNIWKQLKYLAPANRLMLANESFRAEVERGGK